jgi:putative flippase GtrA
LIQHLLATLTKSGVRYDALRFLLAGGLNTLLTFLLYQGLLIWFGPQPAYFFAWVAGLVYVAIVYPDRVFVGSRATPLSRLLVAANYLCIYLLGAGLLALCAKLGVNARISIIFSLVLTTGLGFVTSGRILRRRT